MPVYLTKRSQGQQLATLITPSMTKDKKMIVPRTSFVDAKKPTLSTIIGPCSLVPHNMLGIHSLAKEVNGVIYSACDFEDKEITLVSHNVLARTLGWTKKM